MRNLKLFEEEFVILNRYKNDLTEKKETAIKNNAPEETIKKINDDIGALNELITELQLELNKWANDYNNKKEEKEALDDKAEKSIRERFDENRKKIDKIMYQSKKLQPKFKGSDKKRKHEILTEIGFIETNTVDDRKIFIHPTLVGEYYDLEKIIPTEEESITEKEQTKEERIKDIQKQINYIVNESKGRKQFVTFKGAKYYIPRHEVGKFKVLMTELNKLTNELSHININEKELLTEDKIKELTNEELENEIKSLYQYGENGDIIAINNMAYYNLLKEEKKRREKTKSNTEEILTEEEIKELTDEELNNKIESLCQYGERGNIIAISNIDYYNLLKEEKERRENNKKSEENASITENKEEDDKLIVGVRKPKFKDKIKNILKRLKYIAAAAIIGLGIFGLSKINRNNNEPQAPKQSYENDQNSETNANEEEIDKMISDAKENPDKKNEEDEEIEAELLESEDITLGTRVTLKEGSNVYRTAKDSILEENQYNPRYKDPTEKRVVLGVSIIKDNKTYNIFACTEDAKKEIEELLNDGGKVESVLLGNEEQDKELKDFNGSFMGAEKINHYSEGWYNMSSIIYENNEMIRGK